MILLLKWAYSCRTIYRLRKASELHLKWARSRLHLIYQLSGRFLTPCLPTGNPTRNTLASNFEQINATNSVLRHGQLLTSMNFHLYRTVYSRYKLIGGSICRLVLFLISIFDDWSRFV